MSRLIHRYPGAVIFTTIQAIVVLLALLATPLAQFKNKETSACWTFWGYKPVCSSSDYLTRGTAAFGVCTERRNSMNAGAAFAVLSIIEALVALVFGVLMLLRIWCPAYLPLIFTCATVVTSMISWACVSGAYLFEMCGIKWKDWDVVYGPGFGLLVATTCVQLVNVLMLVLVFYY